MCLACSVSGRSACFVTHGMFHRLWFVFSSKFFFHSLQSISQMGFTQSAIDVETSSSSSLQ